MEKVHFPIWVRVNLDRFGNTVHLMVRRPPWARRLSTACGSRPERDVFDMAKPSWKNAYKLMLDCPECEERRLILIYEEEQARARELFPDHPEDSRGQNTT